MKLRPEIPAVLVLVTVGCTATSPRDFAASRVDRDGCYYSVSDDTPLFDHFSSTLSSAAGGALRGNNPWSRRSAELLLKLRVVYAAIGLDAVKASAVSSVEMRKPTAAGNALFRNRAFCYIEPNAAGLLTAMMPDKNYTMEDGFIRQAASNRTLMAGSCRFNLSAISEFMTAHDFAIQYGGIILPPDFAARRAAAIRSCDGVASFLIFTGKPGKDGKSAPHLYVKLPDRDGSLFELFAALIEANAFGWRSNDSVTFLPRDRGMDSFILFRDGGHTVLVSSGATVDELEKLPQTSGGNEFFKLAGEQLEGIAMLYVNRAFTVNAAKFLENAAPRAMLIFPISAELAASSSLTVLRREENGISALGFSDCDYGTVSTVRTLMPLLLFGEKLLGERVRSDVAAEMDKQRSQSIRGAMKQLYGLLEAYAGKHDGRFPEKSGIEGLKEILSGASQTELDDLFGPGKDRGPRTLAELTDADTPYLYFGGFTKAGNPGYPLLVEGIGRRGGKINVLFIDGRVMEFDAENPASAKHIVSFLHTVFHYPIPDFQKLLEKAAGIDAGKMN